MSELRSVWVLTRWLEGVDEEGQVTVAVYARERDARLALDKSVRERCEELEFEAIEGVATDDLIDDLAGSVGDVFKIQETPLYESTGEPFLPFDAAALLRKTRNAEEKAQEIARRREAEEQAAAARARVIVENAAGAFA